MFPSVGPDDIRGIACLSAAQVWSLAVSAVETKRLGLPLIFGRVSPRMWLVVTSSFAFGFRIAESGEVLLCPRRRTR